MPEAESFTSFGSTSETNPNAALLTGLPSLLPKVNINGEGKWTSLSGWSKVSTPVDDDAKAQSITDSLKRAMELFWNLNGFTGSIHEDRPPNPIIEETFTLYMDSGDYGYTEWFKIAGGSDSDVNKEPEERVCYDGFQAGKLDPFGGGFDVLGMEVFIVRLYDGVTTNEDNFVGYGSSGIFEITIDAFEFFDIQMWVIQCHVSLNNLSHHLSVIQECTRTLTTIACGCFQLKQMSTK